MRRYISADFKAYNANSRDNNVGDCVVRTLSLAYGIDYDIVRAELNKIKRDVREDTYKIARVYSRFIHSHGLASSGEVSTYGFHNGKPTLSEFADKFPRGIYIVTCSKHSQGPTTHIVCIIDGDIWDSWDSSSWYVHRVYCVSVSNEPKLNDTSVSSIEGDITAHIQKCLDKSAAKMPWATFVYGEIDVIDDYTYRQKISCKLDPSKLHLDYAKWWTPGYTYTVKINPRLSRQDNVEKLQSKLWVKVREWAYSIRREIEDDLKIASCEFNPGLDSDGEAIVIKLPEWCRSLITNAEDRGSNEWSDRYVVDMDALPDDPHFETDPCVTFYADTIPELRSNIEDYRKHFWRFGWDY